MSIIDWPSPFASRNAVFKAEPALPNGRGSTRRFTIPELEHKVLGLGGGDKISVDMYDPRADKEISFETNVREKQRKGTNVMRFTIPLRKIDLKDDEFDKGVYHQILLRKSKLVGRLPTINPKRLYNTAIFKQSPSLDANPGRGVKSTLRLTIPKSQRVPINIRQGDKINVVLFRVTEEGKGGLINLNNLQSVNRSVFRAVVIDTGRSFAFSIPSRRRRLKNYEVDDIFQVALKKA